MAMRARLHVALSFALAVACGDDDSSACTSGQTCSPPGSAGPDAALDSGRPDATFLDASPLDASPGSTGGDCSLVGCSSGASFLGWPLMGTLDEIKTRSVEVCRNGRDCVGAALSRLDGVPSDGQGVQIRHELGADAGLGSEGHLFVTVWSVDGGFALDAAVSVWPRDVLQQGDTWRVRLLSSDGAVVQEVERTAGYVQSQPNGPGCAPTCELLSVVLGPDR